jgi:hypothetical protein
MAYIMARYASHGPDCRYVTPWVPHLYGCGQTFGVNLVAYLDDWLIFAKTQPAAQVIFQEL